jgi:hypothetical protein
LIALDRSPGEQAVGSPLSVDSLVTITILLLLITGPAVIASFKNSQARSPGST